MRWARRAGLAVLCLAAGALAVLWTSRERIAGDLIDGYLTDAGLQASYDIVNIGARRQVIENVVIGDPNAPDLTIERVTVTLAYGVGTAEIGAAVLEKPRLYGTYRGGKFSMGALDPLLFGQRDGAQGLPPIDVTIRDGGALFQTDFGEIGVHLEGAGPLDNGFAGKLALVAPDAGIEGCSARRVSAYGELSTRNGAPRFKGPVRLRGGVCEGVTLASADINADLALDSDFAKADAKLALVASGLRSGDAKARGVGGTVRFTLDQASLVLDHDLAFKAIDSRYVSAASLKANGTLRSGERFSQSSWNAQVDGEGLNLAQGAGSAIGEASAAGAGTLFAPLLDKLQHNLAPATQGAGLRAELAWRRTPEAQSLAVPEARLRSTAGETLLAVSRFSWSQRDGMQGARLSGNFLTGGEGLPQVTGRMEQEAGGRLVFRLNMASYAQDENQIALPALTVAQEGGGRFVLSGMALASGAIPGGSVTALELPLKGSFDPRAGLRLGTGCADVRFDALSYYTLDLARQSVRVCPAGQPAMVQYRDRLTLALKTGENVLRGEIAGAPSRVAFTDALLRYPGGFELTDVRATIGPDGDAVHLSSAALSGEIGDAILGQFSGGGAWLDAVPLDLGEMAGLWSYAGGVLTVSDTRFTLTERTDGIARFEPLVSEGASLTLADTAIAALAVLRHGRSGTKITDVAVAHDLSSGEGSALLDVDALTFGPALGVADLTYLAKGVVAYTKGTVSGQGRIAWTGEDVTSSGEFRTDGLDLAAAFGPVRGLRGEVRFSDLLTLTTHPSQVIEIGSINPGIEALSGKVRYTLTDGEIIEVEDARWPFMGGTLVMQPTVLRYGADQEQRYIFEVIGLDAAKFVAQMELTNIGATGTFDGTVPIIFDALGNGRIEGGMLISRKPGGNVSYIGELTYEDLGAISNYAFQALRSLDYTQMRVELEGDLAGEILTRFGIDGVQQGEDASRDIITRRLAKLPIRFVVNVRSENFYELAQMVRTFWDPDALPDPVDWEALRSSGTLNLAPVEPRSPPDPVPDPPSVKTPAIRPDEPGVQPSESEKLP